MDTFQAVSLVAGLFVLRFAVPLVLSLGFSYGMNRVVARWEG